MSLSSDYLLEPEARRWTSAQIAGVLLLVLIVLFAWLGPLLIDADPEIGRAHV